MKKKIAIILSIVLLAIVLILFVFFKFTRQGEQIWNYNLGHAKHFHLQSGDDELFWFYAYHSNEPTDIMFELIEEEFYTFQPDLVLVEGGSNTFEGTKEEAMLEGESEFATYLAKENSIDIKDIEPPFDLQIEHLQNKCSPEAVLTMYIFRQLGSYQMMPNYVSVDLVEELLWNTDDLIANGLDYKYETYEDILLTINEYSPVEITQENWNEIYYPPLYRNDENLAKGYYEDDNIIINVYNEIYFFRNEYLIQFIEENKEFYNKIFIVMGNQHLIDTKEELQEIYS